MSLVAAVRPVGLELRTEETPRELTVEPPAAKAAALAEAIDRRERIRYASGT